MNDGSERDAPTGHAPPSSLEGDNPVRLGLIGFGARGRVLADWASASGQCEWRGVCDAWDRRRDEAASRLRTSGQPVRAYADYRALLDQPDIEAVIIASWDNTHARICLDACRAGKDVYLEKPVASTIADTRAVALAAGASDRVVQVGTQQRGMRHFREASERFFASGRIGNVHLVRTVWNSSPAYDNRVPTECMEKPAGLDWRACLGDLDPIPWDPKRYFNRYAYWDLGTGGPTGSLFIHMADVAHWFLGLTRPASVVALGGTYRHDDGRDTPDNIQLSVEYPDKVLLTFESTLTTVANTVLERLSETERGSRLPEWKAALSPGARESLFEVGMVFHGTNGRLAIWRDGYEYLTEGGETIQGDGSPESDHLVHWLECVRTRQPPRASVRDSYFPTVVAHMANLAYRERRRVEWDTRWALD